MKNIAVWALVISTFSAVGCSHKGVQSAGKSQVSVAAGAGEKHFKSLKQLTFEGTNAEAYFSPDGKKIIFQGHGGDRKCDQIFTMDPDGSNKRLISTKGGRNTCGFFINDHRILFSSTFEAGAECPKEADHAKGYVWQIFKSYNVYTASPDGSDVKRITNSEGYDAESTVCGGKIAFTSARQGNSLDVYTMNLDGSGVERLTNQIGYNGGPFFSSDCSHIVYRAYHPTGKGEMRKFKKGVAKGIIPPNPLEIYVMKSDGSDKKQLTDFNVASFAPSFYPDGRHVIFSSPKTIGPKAFQLWTIDADKTMQAEAEQITSEGTFNGFPMFSSDGKYLLFASNRNSHNPHELQIFLAEWQD